MGPIDRRVEALRALRALLQISERDDDDFEEYIDVREFGLALEVLAYDMVAGGRQPPDAEMRAYYDAAHSMKLEGTELLDEMKARDLRHRKV